MVSGIQAHSVDTILSPLGDHAVVQLSVRYSTTEPHEVIWAYNVLGHMIPIEGKCLIRKKTCATSYSKMSHVLFRLCCLSQFYG